MARAPIDSFQALQSEGKTFCSAFSINEEAGYFATAAHCAVHAIENELDVTINGQPAWVVYVGYPSVDIAVFQTDVHAKALKLSKKAPKVSDELVIVGWPYGITKAYTYGTMAARRIPLIHPSTGYHMTCDILNVVVAGGNSGSAVMNKDGDVVGVLWGSFSESAHSIGVSYEGTIQALAPYVG
jgi:S1-C subfamily serine protease